MVRNSVDQKKFIEIWNKVPVDYYQKGIKRSLLQALWHGKKISGAKKIIRNCGFNNCLDVGCASGYMVSQICNEFPNAKYYGIDAYSKAIQYAKKHYPDIEFKVASADKLPFKDNSLDLIICYETIEHVLNPEDCLKEMKRVLSPKGKLVLAMDSGNLLFRAIWFFWENTKGKVWKGSHIHPFRHRELQELITKTGFNIEKKMFTHAGMEVVFILSK